MVKQRLNSKSTLDSLSILRSKEDLMEEILSRESMSAAYKAVTRNKGAAGVDKMKVSELKQHLQEQWPRIKVELLAGDYKPSPVRKVEIPKPRGGKRELGIPTVLDRLIQQAIMQVLQRYIDTSFSDSSYGFRPGRSAHQAIKQAREHIEGGQEFMVDIDLEKYFDTVNHDKLMSRLKEMIKDQRVLDLIRKYLNTGTIEMGRREKGVPQGSPLSPLLSNIYLDELDKELERRGHTYVRYADDCTIFVWSYKAARRTMVSISHYLESRLKLRVNRAKSKVGREGIFLGYVMSKAKLLISPENIEKFKDSIRAETRKKGGRNIFVVVHALKLIINGWYEYFKLQEDKRLFKELDSWIRRRLRAYYFCKLKNGKTRLKEFLKAGMDYDTAYMYAFTQKGPWRSSKGYAMNRVLSTKRLKKWGLASLER